MSDVVYPLSKGKAVRDRVTGMALFGDRYGMGQPFGGGEFKQRPGRSAEAGGPVKEQEGHVFLLLTRHSLGDNKLTKLVPSYCRSNSSHVCHVCEAHKKFRFVNL